MRTLLVTAIAVAGLALTGCTTATADQTASNEPSGRDCFRSEQVSGYGVIDDHSVRLRASPSRSYVLRTNWNARDLDWANRIAIRSPTGWICTGNGLGVEIIGGDPVQHYPVAEITREPPAPAQGS